MVKAMDDDTINQAIQLSKNGRPQDARKLLKPVLEVEPENEKAWLWYANSFDSAEDKIKALQNCLVYCPNSKMANDGIRILLASLPTAKTSIEDDASALAADLQTGNVQFEDFDSQEDNPSKAESDYPHSKTNTKLGDDEHLINLDHRLSGIFEQREIAPGGSNPNVAPTIVQAGNNLHPTPSPAVDQASHAQMDAVSTLSHHHGHSTYHRYRTPFIILTVIGVILLIILAIIIAILGVS